MAQTINTDVAGVLAKNPEAQPDGEPPSLTEYRDLSCSGTGVSRVDSAGGWASPSRLIGRTQTRMSSIEVREGRISRLFEPEGSGLGESNVKDHYMRCSEASTESERSRGPHASWTARVFGVWDCELVSMPPRRV